MATTLSEAKEKREEEAAKQKPQGKGKVRALALGLKINVNMFAPGARPPPPRVATPKSMAAVRWDGLRGCVQG